jgi:hypothetical protein
MAATARDCKNIRLERGVHQTARQNPRFTTAAVDPLRYSRSTGVRIPALIKGSAPNRLTRSPQAIPQK